MKRQKLNNSVLAEGEVTGHTHRLSGDVEVFQTEEDTKEFNLVDSIDLVHEEHGTITLPPGEFESDQVLEYDSYQEEVRRVQD